jgi:hypothetical protein
VFNRKVGNRLTDDAARRRRRKEEEEKKKRLNAQTNRNKEPRKAVKETAGQLGTQRVNK